MVLPQASVLEDHYHSASKGKTLGFVGLGLVYGFLAVGNLLVPWVIGKVGLRAAMVTGGMMYCLMMASLIHVLEGVFIAASVLNGIGASLLWTAGGAAITNLSDDATRGRNSGVFWALIQLSLLGGALTALFMLSDTQRSVPASTAQELYAILTGVCALGCVALALVGGSSRELVNHACLHAHSHPHTHAQAYVQKYASIYATLTLHGIRYVLATLTLTHANTHMQAQKCASTNATLTLRSIRYS